MKIYSAVQDNTGIETCRPKMRVLRNVLRRWSSDYSSGYDDVSYRVPIKNAPRFLLNLSDHKHPRGQGHNSFERWDP